MMQRGSDVARLPLAGSRRIRMTRLTAWVCALLALLIAAPALGALETFDTKRALRESQAAIGHRPGDYRFTDTEGKTVRLSAFRGKPLVVSFVYTGCFQVCPTTTKHLETMVRQAERALGPGTFRVATVGFNLPFDSPEAMRDFARKQGVRNPNWSFLSPEAGSVQALLADFGFVSEATPAGFDHLLQVSIVDAEGRIYRQVYGDAFDAPQFVGPLLELAQNAPRPAGTLSGLIDEIRLLCTVYDPASGKYRVNYAVLIEILIGTSVLLVGITSVVIEWRRRRRADGAGVDAGHGRRSATS
jgi:protein SCO1/2